MFQYEFERPERSWRGYPNTGGNSRAPPSGSESGRSRPTSAASGHSRRALPLPPPPRPRPPGPCVTPVRRITAPTKPTVPLRVWVIASASCSAVCAALVLATIAITKWGVDTYAPAPEYFHHSNVPMAPVYPHLQQVYPVPIQSRVQKTTTEPDIESDIGSDISSDEDDLQFPILEKLSIFKNIVAKNRKAEHKKDLSLKPQIHPIHDTIEHVPMERKIEKKDQAKLPDKIIPEFKPTLPDVFTKKVEQDAENRILAYANGIRNIYDIEDYYNDENLYNDYLQSNTMTSYLIEKVQELHDWINKDKDFEAVNNATAKLYKKSPGNQFSQLLKALNESLIEGNVTIVMNKLKDLYFGENYTSANNTRKVILSNSTDLLSFGILSLDVMLLHNIQLMAWENQEQARNKMLKDPDVYAFNALFLEPSKVEARHEILHGKRQNLRQDIDDFDIGKNLIENVLEIGMSTARAAIHLGRAYKNTKLLLNQLSSRQDNPYMHTQIPRNIDANTHALNHLQTSFNKNDSRNNETFYTELDCVWLLYCRNLAATAKLNAPYGVMARINGLALRMLTGELSADKALDTMLYEALTGWSELQCNDMFPRCSKANPAAVVMESILQPLKKSQTNKV